MKAADSSGCSQHARAKDEGYSVPCSKRCLWSCLKPWYEPHPQAAYSMLPLHFRRTTYSNNRTLEYLPGWP